MYIGMKCLDESSRNCSWSCRSLVPKAQVEMLTIHAWLLFENLSNCVEYKCVCMGVCVQHHKAQQLLLAEPQLLAAWNDKYAIGPKVHDFYMHFSVASAVVLPLAMPPPPSSFALPCRVQPCVLSLFFLFFFRILCKNNLLHFCQGCASRAHCSTNTVATSSSSALIVLCPVVAIGA